MSHRESRTSSAAWACAPPGGGQVQQYRRPGGFGISTIPAMSQSKGRHQREHGLAVMSTPAPEAQQGWSPDPDAVEDWPFEVVLLSLGRIIGRQGLDTETGRLIEFAISAQVNVGGRWWNVARVDTCHEEVHLHVLSRTEQTLSRTVLLPIYGPKDVDRGWQMGERKLVSDWEEHVRRWRSGR
jgi:hypothetical protein